MGLHFALEENRRNADADISEGLALALNGKIYVVNPRSAIYHFQLAQETAIAHMREILPLLQLRTVGGGIGVYDGAAVYVCDGGIGNGWGVTDNRLQEGVQPGIGL